jgi:probable phosphoglycerate mutase
VGVGNGAGIDSVALGPCTLVLSRHGQTVWHRENRYAGVSDIDLTETGRLQADSLAEWARTAQPQAIVCSPVRRAVETARPSADVLGLRPHLEDDLREVSFGVAEGRTMAEMHADDSDMVAKFRDDPVSHPFPGSDSIALAAQRGADALVRTAAEHPGETVLVVAHNTLLRLALCSLLGIEVRRYRTVFPRLDNGTLTTLRISPGQTLASLLSFNVPLHPPT